MVSQKALSMEIKLVKENEFDYTQDDYFLQFNFGNSEMKLPKGSQLKQTQKFNALMDLIINLSTKDAYLLAKIRRLLSNGFFED